VNAQAGSLAANKAESPALLNAEIRNQIAQAKYYEQQARPRTLADNAWSVASSAVGTVFGACLTFFSVYMTLRRQTALEREKQQQAAEAERERWKEAAETEHKREARTAIGNRVVVQ
jgi:predicted PurR-regulated permease PerM